MILMQLRTQIRDAQPDDMPAIMAMRDRQGRASAYAPVNVQWIVAEVNGIVRACEGVAIATAEGHGRTIIATDLYDDGTREGKRALVALLDDARQAIANGVRIYAIVPLDRPQLVRHLERRGMPINGYCLG